MPNLIQAVVSKRKLTFIPDVAADTELTFNGENEFDVVVTNASQEFTSFQLELIAPGLDPQTDIEWYTVEPEVCAKKPPGARTSFHIAIKKAPIPAYETTLDLTLNVFSVERANLSTSQPISLTIEKPRRSLRIYLPAKELKVFPGDDVEIPVIVYNLDSKSATVILSILKLDVNWLVVQPGAVSAVEQTLTIEPGDSQKTSFRCQPPKHFSTLSQRYPFTVEVRSTTSHFSTREQGNLEVLPQGTVIFDCDPDEQTIPASGQSSPQKQRGAATYTLQFENDSNQPQTITIDVSESDRPSVKVITPPPLILQPGEAQEALLVAQKHRPWFGLSQRFLLEVAPVLVQSESEDSAIQPHPSSKTLELKVLPMISPALQIGGPLLALLLLWLLWLLRPVGHQSVVNFVRFSGDGTTVLSGSSDQTVRRWFVNRTIWQPDRLLHGEWSALRLNSPDNISDRIGKAVRVLRHGQKNNLVAVGLEDGTIQLWDTAFTAPQKILYRGTDRVFDLVFTRDSRLLFSGHGSGIVRLWAIAPGQQPRSSIRQIRTSIGEGLPPTRTEPQRIYFPFAVAALAISEPENAAPMLAVAGQFNRLVLWDWNTNTLYSVPYTLSTSGPQSVMGMEQAIVSLATANNLLVAADNQGYITIWDVRNRHCNVPNRNEGQCQLQVLDQWQTGHGGQPVRGVALTQDGKYLSSVGDDGRVMLWTLDQGKRSANRQQGELLADYPIRLNSVDITEKNNTLFITSDADHNRVMLYHIQKD
jgi:WD40 repeat protein